MQTRIIIFSSSEGINLARKIQINLQSEKHTCKTWKDNFFKLGDTTLDCLQAIRDNYNLSIVVISPDDLITSRDKKSHVPRDNVVFEMGLCIGTLGKKRTILVNRKGVKLPSDLAGVTTCEIPDNSDDDANAAVIASRINTHIEENEHLFSRIHWEEYSALVDEFLRILKRPPHRGGVGFKFDAIISISRGGMVLSDLVSRTYGFNMPVYYLFKDREDYQGHYDSPAVYDKNTFVADMINKSMYKNILVLDSAERSSGAITKAANYLRFNCPEKVFKFGVLIADNALKENNFIDFVVEYRDTRGLDFYYNAY